MPETTDKIISLIDESFSQEETSRYSLVMEIELRKISYSLLDVDKNKFIGAGSSFQSFHEMLGSMEWMRKPFHSKKIIISNSKSTLIPAALYSKEEKEGYLDFNMEREQDDIVLSDWLENLGVYNVYSLAGKLQQEIRVAFPGAKLCHVSSVLIESLFVNYKNLMGDGRIFLNVRDEAFDLVLFQGKQLSYVNSFLFRAPEDLVYYVIFVIEQMNLNPEETPIVLLGDTDKRSAIYDLLFRYIRNLDFAGRNETFNYSYVLNDIPPHSFYTLFNSGQCGS